MLWVGGSREETKFKTSKKKKRRKNWLQLIWENDVVPRRYLAFREEKYTYESESSVCWWLLPFLPSKMEAKEGDWEVLLLDIWQLVHCWIVVKECWQPSLHIRRTEFCLRNSREKVLFERVVSISIVIQLVELVWKFTHYYSDDNQKYHFFNFL